MNPVRRRARLLLRLVVGTQPPPPVVRVALVIMLSWTAITSFWAFVTIWGARELHATGTELGLTFLASAVAAACVSYLGGRLADMIGDRPILLTSRAGLAVVALAAAVAEPGLALGLGLIIAASIVNALAAPVEQTLIVAAVPPADQEAAFSVARVAQTIGFTIGPLLGAALLFAGWPVLFAGVAVLALSTVVVAGALLPARAARDTQKARAALSPFRDPRFTGFLVVGSVAMTAYFAYELVLPVSLVQSHGVSAVWFFVGGLTLVGALLLPLILATGTEPALDRQRDASDATAARLS